MDDYAKTQIDMLLFNAGNAAAAEDYLQAEKYLNDALELDPNNPHSLNSLGVCFGEQEKYADAQKCFEQALLAHPNDELLLANLSYCLFEQSEYEKALNCLNLISLHYDSSTMAYGNRKLTKQAIEYCKDYNYFENTQPVSSLCEYIEVISKIKKTQNTTFIYRGQDNHFYPLKASLYREDNYDERGENIIKDFNLKADAYFNHEMAHFDKVDKLALMQHHGVPTKLLDFTESPLVALYFALEDTDGDNYYDKAPCVYVLNVNAFEKNVDGRILPSSEVSDNSKDDMIIFKSNLEGLDFAFSPKLKSKRLTAQKGVFVFMNENKALEESVKESITKIVISRQKIRKIKQELKNLGITPTTIYPDYEGLAKEIKNPRKFAKEENLENKPPLGVPAQGASF